jgi:hypothetical protein
LITASTILPPCMETRMWSPTLGDLAGMKEEYHDAQTVKVACDTISLACFESRRI